MPDRTHISQLPQHLRQRGFTLLELMLVVAIVGVIVGIAIPALMDNMAKSRRSDARSLLMQIAGKQESFFQNNRDKGYSSDFTKLGELTAQAITAASVTSEHGYYTITINIPDDCKVAGRNICYELIATATGRQANDACKTLTIEEDGSKSFTPNTAKGCW